MADRIWPEEAAMFRAQDRLDRLVRRRERLDVKIASARQRVEFYLPWVHLINRIRAARLSDG